MTDDRCASGPHDLAAARDLLLVAPFAYVAMVDHVGPHAEAWGGAAQAEAGLDGAADLDAASADTAPAGARPYVVPMNFAYELPAATDGGGRSGAHGRIYLHTGKGRKSAALAREPRVCVAITGEATFVQGPTPCKDGFAFRSVVVEGWATLLESPEDRERALRVIVAKYDPGAATQPFGSKALAATLVYSVDIETISYRTLPK